MATIIIRNSTGSGAVPSSLVQGELAINTVDGKLFYGSGSGNIAKEFTANSSSFATSASYATQAGNAAAIDIYSFSSPVESYLLMSNVVGTTGVAVGGDTDLRYNSSTNVLTVPNISSTSFTASNATISGNVTVLGTASINTLVVNQIGYSSGSNQLGDAADDTQTLYGSVIIPTGSLTVTGSVQATGGFTGSFSGSVAAPGSTTQVIYNNGGVLGANSGFVYNGSNIGIGTTPSSYRLDISGSLRINPANTTALISFENLGSAQSRLISDSNFAIWNSGSETVRFLNGGNVGIGNSTPTSRLQVRGSGTTSSTTALRVENTNASASLVVLDDGAVGIGTSTPSSSILLDVSGSIRSFNILPAANGSYDIGVSANKFRNGWFAGSLVAPSGYLNNLFFGITNFGIYNSIGTQLAQMFSTGDLVLQNGGTFTNNNYRLQVNATGSNSGSLFLGGTTIATGSIARTMLISSSLSASANNDVLVGLDINPSFNAGSFTGVERTAIRFGTIKIGLTAGGADRIDFGSQVNIQRSGENILTATTVSTSLNSRAVSVPILFTLNQGVTEVGRFAATTGNFLINTTTDSGFKLDVSGSARITNGLTVTGSLVATSFTGSLLGTASWAVNALTASFVNTASTNAFVQGGNSFGAQAVLGTNDNQNLALETSGSVRMFISSSGQVGIGTSTPISAFTIQTLGNVQSTQPIISAVGGSTFAGWLIYTGSSERVRYAWNTSDGAYVYTATTDPFTVFTNGTRALRIDSSQNVGIGTGTDTPSARVQVRGSGATSATTALIVQNSTPTNIITVLNNGVVGINRTPTASLDVAGTTRLSGSFNTATSGSILTVIGSGSTQPIFTVQGSQGELFSITDSLTGSLFSVNDISGLPILEVFSDNTTLIGDYQDPMLVTTKKVTMTNSGSFVVYSLPTASYDTAFFDYSIKSGSNARAGQIMAIQSGSSVNFTETTTTDFGSTAAVSFTVLVSGSNMVLTGSASVGSWTIKTIVRGI